MVNNGNGLIACIAQSSFEGMVLVGDCDTFLTSRD